ncbi:GSCOCT00007980001.2-RA-CDS [Cotesia congregata]|uniref:Trypsin I-P1-like n=1 Tax=Cotesia congregata TaxID=51543 RepID=A0A8J2EMM5_COTCN|nr:GSCOCT00007980001.2-RA-CDS [Cotesia congregata]CAG5074120.1 trypsin I-P1-like [Cotesia congregata]
MFKQIFGIVLVLVLIIVRATSGFSLQNLTRVTREKRAANVRLLNCYCDDLNKLCQFSDAIDLRITNEECPDKCEKGQAKYCDIGFGMTNEVCGLRKLTTTSLPEGVANLGEYPWHVAILQELKKKLYKVGAGVLITSNHVLTVAHKVSSIPQTSLIIRIGDTSDYGEDICRRFDYRVQFMITHPTFDDNIGDDIALLRLTSSVPLANNPHINFACLPMEVPKAKKRCWVSGWSEEPYRNFGASIYMKEVNVPIVDDNECEARLQTTRLSHNFKLDKKSLICAGGEPGKDSCSGDGGAPLICERANGQWEVVGLVAGGVSCGQPIPGLYVNVRNYVPWIHEQIANTC